MRRLRFASQRLAMRRLPLAAARRKLGDRGIRPNTLRCAMYIVAWKGGSRESKPARQHADVWQAARREKLPAALAHRAAVGLRSAIQNSATDPYQLIDSVAVQRTFMAKPGQVEKQWHVVDATDEVLGRLASDIAVVLMGKHRPEYTPHVDCGDFVIVTNAEKVAMTGNKMRDRHYTWYTGYPGLRLESYGDRQQRKPEDLIRHAVRRMLPKNKLAYSMLNKLKIYSGDEHPHAAQQPTTLQRKGKKVTA